MTAARRWAEALGEWAIPAEILRAAPESPWGFPTEVFASAARSQLAAPPSSTHRRVIEAMPPGGVLLDVGAGAGAASLPTAPPTARIVAVDGEQKMLDALRELAAGRVDVETVAGRWPDVAAQVPAVDVVVCANVFYNVADLPPFVDALTAKAGRRVVVELTAVHPQSRLNPLWQRFWGLTRPTAPTGDDAVEVVREVTGRAPSVDRWTRTYRDRVEPVAWIRQRLCLSADRDDEVADALATLPTETEMVTLSWDGAG